MVAQEEYERETEEITINGISVVLKVNLPNKSKLSQWCQNAKKEFPEYTVAFLEGEGRINPKHIARVRVDGVEVFAKSTKKNKAEAAAAYMLLSGVRFTPDNAFQVRLQADFNAGELVASNKNYASNATKSKRRDRMTEYNLTKQLNLQEAAAVPIEEQASQVQEAAAVPIEEEEIEHVRVQLRKKVVLDADGVVCIDIERSGGPEDSEIIQLSYASCRSSGNSYIVPEGGIDPYASKNCHKLFKRGGKLYKENEELPTETMEAAAEKFIKFLEGITDPVIVCYGDCDWVTLMNNFALCGYERKLAKTIRGVLNFQSVVTDEPSLNRGSISLVKLDTEENLTERLLGNQITRDELKKGAHDARFDTDILMRVFREYMKSYERELEDILTGNMLRSQDLANLAESKVDRIMQKRMRKMKAKQLPFKVFNGWQ